MRSSSKIVLSTEDLRKEMKTFTDAVQQGVGSLLLELKDDLRREIREELQHAVKDLAAARLAAAGSAFGAQMLHREETQQSAHELPSFWQGRALKTFKPRKQKDDSALGTPNEDSRRHSTVSGAGSAQSELEMPLRGRGPGVRGLLVASAEPSRLEPPCLDHALADERQLERRNASEPGPGHLDAEPREAMLLTARSSPNTEESTALISGLSQTGAGADTKDTGGSSNRNLKRSHTARMQSQVIATDRGILHEFAANIVRHGYFEQAIGLVVLLNAVALGLETEFQAHHRHRELPSFLSRCETAFCVIFTLELLLRIFVYRSSFLRVDAWQWNMFDVVIVGMQLAEQATIAMRSTHVLSGASNLRIVRVLRLIRITRLLRVLRLQEELRTIMTSIIRSMESLGWTLLLLAMIVYMFSVLFTQVVAESVEADNFESLQYWFGSLPRTILTLYESITGGVSWDSAVVPLIADVSPLLGVAFCFYMLICIFAIMNVVTAAFVDKASRTAQEDKDIYLANHISDLFFQELGSSQAITWDEFSRKIDSKEMQEYFRQINVDPSEARGLFELIDADGSGCVDPEEMVDGCLRLRGTAKALELSLLMHECNRMHQRFSAHQAHVEHQLALICKTLRG